MVTHGWFVCSCLFQNYIQYKYLKMTITAYYKSYNIMILFKQFGYYEAAGRDTGITSILPESSSICNTGTDTGKY